MAMFILMVGWYQAGSRRGTTPGFLRLLPVPWLPLGLSPLLSPRVSSALLPNLIVSLPFSQSIHCECLGTSFLPGPALAKEINLSAPTASHSLVFISACSRSQAPTRAEVRLALRNNARLTMSPKITAMLIQQFFGDSWFWYWHSLLT